MDVEGPRRLDAFPYRHRVRDVMGAPPVTCRHTITIAEAAGIMATHAVSAVVATDGANGPPKGIVTERDVLRAVAADVSLDQSIERIMSRPVHTVAGGAFVYVAVARMDRLGIRHLAVTDKGGALMGVVSSRALLKLRARTALVLGDEVQTAGDAGALAAAVGRLPTLARALLEESISAPDVARVISGVMRDATMRAAELAEAALAKEGQGGAPAPYAVLVLGSAGRGESLLAPDQDNAIIHAGTDADDPWFAELGRRMCAILDAAGIPYCRGKVMASEPAWRRTRQGWRAAIDGWVGTSSPENLLNVDIFYDFRAVHGAHELAESLSEDAIRAAAGARAFLRLLAAELEKMTPPIGLMGTLRSEAGRVDVKLGGLLPIVTAARIMALKSGSSARATGERLAAAVEAGRLGEADRRALADAHAFLLGLVLDQQLADIDQGIAPSNRVALDRLDRANRRRLKEALRQSDRARHGVHDVLTA